MKIRLTKEFCFEMSHALDNYDGLCRNIHGHSYKLMVTIKGEPIRNRDNPKCGMVMDFGDLKRIVESQIIDKYDHALVLNRNSSFAQFAKDIETKMVLSDYQPTCENFLTDFAQRISDKLPQGIELVSLRLHETATSFAEWFAKDNE